MCTDGLGILFILIGGVLFSIWAHESEKVSVRDIEHNFNRKPFMIYLGVQTLVVLILLSMIVNSSFYKWRAKFTKTILRPVFEELQTNQKHIQQLATELQRLKDDMREMKKRMKENMGIQKDSGTSQYWATVSRMSITMNEKNGRVIHWYDAYIYAACGGIIGAFSVLFAGITSKLLIFDIETAFQYAIFYVAAVLMIFCLISQTHLLTSAL
eukprot:UN31163